MNIDNTTARQYLLDRVGELRAQVPHGNPFVFTGAFQVLNGLARVFNSSIYGLLRDFGGFSDNEASVTQTGARLMFEGFTLTEPNYENSLGYVVNERTITTYSGFVISSSNYEPEVKKLNLSHKDRQHRKISIDKLTLSAGAFLEDVEAIINKAFDSVKDDEVAGARLFVRINEQPFIGYGE